MMNRRSPARLAGAGLAGGPAARGCASAPDDPPAGEGRPAGEAAVNSVEGISAGVSPPGRVTWTSSVISKARDNKLLTERFGHFLVDLAEPDGYCNKNRTERFGQRRFAVEKVLLVWNRRRWSGTRARSMTAAPNGARSWKAPARCF